MVAMVRTSVAVKNRPNVAIRKKSSGTNEAPDWNKVLASLLMVENTVRSGTDAWFLKPKYHVEFS